MNTQELLDSLRTYLGDGLYVSYDGYQIRLYASDGERVLGEVFLDEATIGNFQRYLKNLDKVMKEYHDNGQQVDTEEGNATGTAAEDGDGQAEGDGMGGVDT